MTFFKVVVFAALLVTAGAGHTSDNHQVRVVDGDTLELGGVKYRLHGIDAPEAGQLCRTANRGTWPCGQEAIKTLQMMVRSHALTCDNRGYDKYGRTLAVCSIAGTDINAAMINKGMAWSFKRYSHDYDEIEAAAKANLVGIWQADTETPWDYRAHRWQIAKQDAPAGCSIKGNISNKGEPIYHMPWSKGYARTRINEKKGERWFCTEAEAIAAGWRAPWGD
ncbi:thermonuclease family protein [Mesorhizobium sp. M1006]|uniref:thermonuclease family protein n=1 Tax=Mesorhizobium sp. M1006 TaxID=2957048 RepID=UPI00333D7342